MAPDLPLSSKPETKRLFFALWPESTISRKLHEAACKLLPAASRCVVPENIHLTLAFLGSRKADFKKCAEQAAGAIRTGRFTMTLEEIGYWKKSGILWAGPMQPPGALLALVRELNAGLAPCGYEAEMRPYAAHLTLARDVRKFGEKRSIEPLVWQVREFFLVQSMTHREGARYEILRQWELR